MREERNSREVEKKRGWEREDGRRRGDIVDGGGVRQYVQYDTIQYYDYEKTSPGRFSPAHRTAPGGIAALREPRSKITRKGRFIKALAFVLGNCGRWRSIRGDTMTIAISSYSLRRSADPMPASHAKPCVSAQPTARYSSDTSFPE